MNLRPNFSQVFSTKFANAQELLKGSNAPGHEYSKSWPGYPIDLMQCRLSAGDIQAFTKACQEWEERLSTSALRKLQVGGALGFAFYGAATLLDTYQLTPHSSPTLVLSGFGLLVATRLLEPLPFFQSPERRRFDQLRLLTEKIPLTHPSVKLALHRPAKDPIREFADHLAQRGYVTALEVQMLNRAELGRENYFVSRKLSTR